MMAEPRPPDPRLFAALGDATRLRLLQRLHRRPGQSITTLAEAEPISRQAISRHLTLLAEVGVLRARREGRERVWELCPAPLHDVSQWIEAMTRTWESRLDRLEAFLDEPQSLPEEEPDAP